MSGWVKCSERMPEAGETILISFRGCVRMALCKREDVINVGFVDCRSGYGIPATAWQPLPTPYKD